MSKLAPKGFLDWIFIIFMVVFVGLIVFTLVAGDSPFDLFGADPMTTTIIFAGIVVGLGVIYRLTRK